jgi:hypothetical protein
MNEKTKPMENPRTSKTAGALGTNLSQKKSATALPVSFLLRESPVGVFREIENVLCIVERDNKGRFCICCCACNDGGRPTHGNFK